jgi:hypothetical protein
METNICIDRTSLNRTSTEGRLKADGVGLPGSQLRSLGKPWELSFALCDSIYGLKHAAQREETEGDKRKNAGKSK